MRKIAGRWWPALGLAIACILIWAGWKRTESLRFRRTMVRVEEDMENGLYALAARNLAAVLADRPDLDEAHFLLGNCEMARGRQQAAAAAWARVPPDSPFAARAILGQMQLTMERGRFSDAEQIIKDALADPRIDGSSLPILLGPIYCQQGRLDETLRLIEARWQGLIHAGEGASESAINLVRAHIELRQTLVPTDAIRLALDQAAQLAPDDDRVWLGKANLAIRAGSFDLARRWLDDCRRKRPDDQAVWRARLDWAMAADRVDEARACLPHLQAQMSTPAQVYKIAAWFAVRRGDATRELQELERLIAADPTDFQALDRLVELSRESGLTERAAELGAKKSDVERELARYRKLHNRHQPRRDAMEMARLAEQLGQPFEARGFLTLAIDLEPDRQDLRQSLATLVQDEKTNAQAGRSLAELIAPEAGHDTVREPHLTSGPVDTRSLPQ
jgi:tetratricopeptide (TPR) repeat protein